MGHWNLINLIQHHSNNFCKQKITHDITHFFCHDHQYKGHIFFVSTKRLIGVHVLCLFDKTCSKNSLTKNKLFLPIISLDFNFPNCVASVLLCLSQINIWRGSFKLISENNSSQFEQLLRVRTTLDMYATHTTNSVSKET